MPAYDYDVLSWVPGKADFRPPTWPRTSEPESR